MKLFIVFILIAAGVAARPTWAGDEASRPQVLAATKDAVSNLLDEVARVPLNAQLTVGDFLRQTRSTEEMVRVLQRAQQMGGARWIDDHTCQVELQISGPIVAQQLKRTAAADPRRSPLGARELDFAVRNWDERAFTATGTATSRVPVVGAGGRNGGDARVGSMPNHGVGFVGAGGAEGGNGVGANDRVNRDRWRDVNDADRDQAIAAAKADAARRSLASLRGISVTRDATVGDVLRVREVDDGMHDWFLARKVARVDLNPDGEAAVELSAAPVEAFDAFRGLAQKQKDVPVPSDAAAWDRVKREFDRQMVTPIGRAVAPLAGGSRGAAAAVPPAHGKGADDIGNTPIGRKPAVVMPDRAPNWTDRRLSANGQGTPDRKSKLRAARAAESTAEDKLRRDIEQLPLTEKQTLGQAAKAEPRIDHAITRAINRARISRANYHDDGSADVDVYLDLDILWQELRDAQ